MDVTGFPERSAQRENLRGGTTIMAKEYEATEGIMFDGDSFFARELLTAYPDQEHLGDFFFERWHHWDHNTA
jgi:hypothetical protein